MIGHFYLFWVREVNFCMMIDLSLSIGLPKKKSDSLSLFAGITEKWSSFLGTFITRK